MGSRYGVKIRKKHDEMTSRSRASYACVKCGKKSVRKDGYARWQCRSCKVVFAGGAYSPETMVGASARRVLKGEKISEIGGAVDLEALAQRKAEQKAEEESGE